MQAQVASSSVAMIAGATGGIGGAIARSMYAAGYRLSLGARRPEQLKGFDDPERARSFRYDASRVGDETAWVAATVACFGRIDVVINAAGILRNVTLEEGSDDDLDAMFEVNVKGPFRLIRAALPELKKLGRGRIINVASLSGKRVRNLNAGYQMSKFALVALTHAVRRAGWEHGIRATAVCPGWVRTGMTVNAPPGAEFTEPEELADLVTTVAGLSNTAAIAELLVNCGYENTL